MPGRPSASDLDRVYDEPYFNGETSGYPSSGYRRSHPDWSAWLGLIQKIKATGVLIDLGCAFGYLVKEARERGYRSFGLDISSYALRQEPSFHPWLVRAHLQSLPLKDQTADVVTLFDVLEHLNDPRQALAEAVRILKGDGLLVGATPDPLYFDRDEVTHVCERPPSFWLAAIRALGLHAQFRFSVDPYNFQFLAAFPGTAAAESLGIFQHDYFEARSDMVSGCGVLSALPRWGWGPSEDRCRRLDARQAALYLWNPGPAPVSATVSFRVTHGPQFATLRVVFDSLALTEICLTSEKTDHGVQLPEFLVPQGGHHLFFELWPQGPDVKIGDVQITTAESTSRQLALSLPFDLFQRYQVAAEVCEILAPQKILDIGGALGDRGGHLATSRDFLAVGQRPAEVRSTDLRQVDYPEHEPACGWKQPFADQSFDLVLSLDVLEHLPPSQRTLFLEEMNRLARHWIILGAPFYSPEVEEAEEQLRCGLLSGQQFLSEHAEQGLPRREEIEEFFGRRCKYELHALPNGYLPRWRTLQMLTQYYFNLKDSRVYQTLNRLYNENWYPYDQARPAYRTVWLICKEALEAPQISALEALRTSDPESAPKLETALFQHPQWVELHSSLLAQNVERDRNLQDLQFLINERQKLIELQKQELEWLRQELERTPLRKLARRRIKKRWGY